MYSYIEICAYGYCRGGQGCGPGRLLSDSAGSLHGYARTKSFDPRRDTENGLTSFDPRRGAKRREGTAGASFLSWQGRLGSVFVIF